MIKFTEAVQQIHGQLQQKYAQQLQNELLPYIEVEAEARGLPKGTEVDFTNLCFKVEEEEKE